VVLRKDTQNLQRWLTDVGGGYLAAGIGTGILGKGAHVLIIDDPVKDAEAADSETQRQSAMDWYTGVAASRLAPGAGVVIIMQRWHDLDLGGRLLRLQKELEESEVEADAIEKWEVVEYAMEAEQDEHLTPNGQIFAGPLPPEGSRLLRRKGEPLHPERYNDLEMRRIKNRLLRTNPRHWHALYQQKPVPDEGEFFQTSMFRYIPSVPDWSQMRIITAWDLAIGLKQRNDYTVGVVGGLDYEDNLYILDMVRGKFEAPEIIDNIVQIVKRYDPFSLGIEHGQISMSIMPTLVAALRKERLYVQIDETLKPVTDKQARAKPLQARMGVGAVYFPQNQPWVEKIKAEFLRFPNGENDDIVDAMAWLARLAQNVPVPVRAGKPKPKGWRDQLHLYTGGNQRSHMSA
jgi:predicted phage terminase large subunit-like protein